MKTLNVTATIEQVPEFQANLAEEAVVRNAPGGYYIPAVEQVDPDTVKISFAASKSEMPALEEQTIVLPAGRDGVSPMVSFGAGTELDGTNRYTINIITPAGYINSVTWHDGKDGITPHIGDNGNWFFGTTDTGKPSRGEGAGVPDYWMPHLSACVEEIRQALETAGRNKSAFLFYTDTHWESFYMFTNAQKSPALLKYLSMNTPIRKTFFGGDVVAEESDERAYMEYLWRWRAAVCDLPHHHSVPGDHDDGHDINNRYSQQRVYAFLQAAEETPDIVRSEEGLWYYMDWPCERTRYLCMDTACQTDLDAQAAFMIDALETMPAGWHAVAVSHIWLQKDYAQDGTVFITGIDATAAKWLALFDAYNQRQSGTMILHTTASPYDFRTAGGRVEFCIGGHTHLDCTQYASEGGIPVVTVEADGATDWTGTDVIPGTISEQSVNAVIADYSQRKLHIIRIGRGSGSIVDLIP